MTNTMQDNANPPPTKSRPVWLVYLIVGALTVGFGCTLGALFLLRQAGDLVWRRDDRPMAAVTVTLPAATTTPPPAATATATRITSTATPGSPTSTPTTVAAPTSTATATPTSTATTGNPSSPTRVPPTPFVCDSVYTLADIELAPEQTFQCTLRQQELTDVANNYPDSPCSQMRITLDNGEIAAQCQRGILQVRVDIAARTEACRVELEVVGGTAGFRQIIAELIKTQYDVIRYDSICVAQLDIDDGQLFVAGYGR
jgi:hypothetical protein